MFQLEIRELLEEKTGSLLLIAGGFLLVDLAVRNLLDVVGFTAHEGLPEWIGFVFSSGIISFVGLGLPFVALFGLYYRLTSETPRLAAVGGALMVFTPFLFVGGLLTMLIRPLPDLPNLLFLSPLPYVAGVGSFGLAFFRKDGSIRFVGVPLLGFSGTWTLVYAVGLQNGGVPEPFPFVELLAVSLVAMGYLLHGSSANRTNGTPTGS